MVRIIASLMTCLVLLVGKEVFLCVLDALLESVEEKVILPVSPPGQIYLRSAALFRWSSALPPDTHRVPAFRSCSSDVLDPNVMLPVSTEVILVQKPLTEAETKIRQPDMSRVVG